MSLDKRQMHGLIQQGFPQEDAALVQHILYGQRPPRSKSQAQQGHGTAANEPTVKKQEALDNSSRKDHHVSMNQKQSLTMQGNTPTYQKLHSYADDLTDDENTPKHEASLSDRPF